MNANVKVKVDQLLTTKLYIPQLNINLVPRLHLYERLDEGLTRKLTLISAPAGFGKSTLVTSWLAESNKTAAWLSLGKGDNDPVRFWTYFIAAIQTIHQETGGEARQIISAPQLRNIEPVVISLINEISQLSHDLIVVLDDYHLIQTEQIHSSLNYLLDRQPQNLHIVLITRADPSISLARLRAHVQLIEIRAQDLQFTTEEATTLLNEKMGLNLKLNHVKALVTHTESWVVGLQLAALSLKNQPSYDTFIEEFTGGNKFILDYLIEEVLVTLPDAQREFMLRTSILDRFCSELCRAVTGDSSSAQMMEEIWKSNLFLIPLDTEGWWFRYHHLFAEVLYALLKRNYPDEIASLHLKAAEWFEKEGYPGEAVEHALRSGEMVRAKELVLKYWTPVLHKGEVATVLHWISALPEEMRGEDPNLTLAYCWALFLNGQFSAIEPNLELASEAFDRLVRLGNLSGLQQNMVAAQVGMMRSVLARDRGEHAKSVTYVENATRLMPPKTVEGIGTAWNMLAAARAGAGDFEGAIEAYERGIELTYAEGNLIGAFGCTYGQVMFMLAQGQLNRAEELCRSSIDRAVREGQGNFPAAGWLYIAMSRINLERMRLDKANAYLRDGLRIARPGGFSEAVRSGRYLRTQLAAARGDLEAATDFIQETARIVNAMDEPFLSGELNSHWAALCLKAGDLDSAGEKLQILDEKIVTTQHAILILWRGGLFPRLLCAEKRYKEARTALDESIHRARAANSNGELIRLLALQALTLEALGDHEPARYALQEGLALGADEGYILRWLDAGPGIVTLLDEMQGNPDTPRTSQTYLDSILDACQAAFGESTTPRSGELPDPFTTREMEIMRLINKGYSNPEIADELVVTINTIKKHTSNIYGKLGVRSRTQAIARAHELNLL
ncbi:MAG TPA: LuxR C-terminal-related transcriptional regulator [Anaerolineales bacterium]|nr:LuxR C-terminal-related transcriptional regulator [Anaerolineales bacterium]